MLADPVLQRFQNHVAGFALRHTVGLYAVDEYGKSTVWGTGILLEIGLKCFVVTAAHVAVDGKTIPLAIGIPNSEVPFVKIKGCETYHSTSKCGDHSDDELDLAVIDLSEALVARIRETRQFLHVRDLDLGDRITSFGMYLVLGLPKAWSRQEENKTTSEVLSLSALPQAFESVPSVENLNPKSHFVLDYGRTPFFGRDGNQVVKPPPPGGISGCGVWRIATAADMQHPDLLPPPQLVGIVTGWYESKLVLKGSRIALALGLILKKFPELNQVLRICWPVPTATPHTTNGVIVLE